MSVRRPFLLALLFASVRHGALAAEAGDAPSVQLEELVVTGEKVERGIQDTPTSVAVVTARDIEEQNLVDVYDLITAPRTSTPPSESRASRSAGSPTATSRGRHRRPGDGLSGRGAAAPRGRRHRPAGPLGPGAGGDPARPAIDAPGRNALAGAIVLRTEDPTLHLDGQGARDPRRQGRAAALFRGDRRADRGRPAGLPPGRRTLPGRGADRQPHAPQRPRGLPRFRHGARQLLLRPRTFRACASCLLPA